MRTGSFLGEDEKAARAARLCALLFSAALMLRALAAGFVYEPILDDSIQYINYPSASDYGALIRQEGLFSSRPLAALTDLFFVGQMRSCLLVPVLFFALMHGAAAALWMRLFRRYFGTGEAFAVVYALLPLGTEGTYWLSASSRIVPGLFFAALSATLFDAYIERGGLWRVPLFALCELLSYGFYEQILVLSFAVTGLIFLRSAKNRRAWWGFLAFPLLAVYFLFTSAHAGGSLAGRMELALPDSPWYWKTFVPELLRQIGAAFVKGGWRTLTRGAWRGILYLVSGFGGVLYLILALACGAGLFFLARPRGKLTVVRLSGWGGALVWGLLLVLAPLAPYFVIANPYFSLRATVPSFVGAGLLIDLALRALIRSGRVYAAVSGVLACICLVAGASEVSDYQACAAQDAVLAREILAHESEMTGRTGILGLEEYSLPAQNYAYHEHIASAASSEWALYGKLVAAAGRELTCQPVPLATEGFSFYHGWNTDTKRLSGFDALWAWEDGALTPLTAERTGENDFTLRRPDGSVYADVWEEDGYGYIRRFLIQ